MHDSQLRVDNNEAPGLKTVVVHFAKGNIARAGVAGRRQSAEVEGRGAQAGRRPEIWETRRLHQQ